MKPLALPCSIRCPGKCRGRGAGDHDTAASCSCCSGGFPSETEMKKQLQLTLRPRFQVEFSVTELQRCMRAEKGQRGWPTSAARFGWT